MNTQNHFRLVISARKLFLLGVALLSVLLAAYGPMTTYSHAQSTTSAELKELKEKALTELDRRIAKYQKSMDSLNVDIEISKDNVGTPSAGATFTYSENGIVGTVALPSGTQDKVKQFTQKMIDQLKGLKSKISNATSLTTMQDIAKNIDAQYELDKLTDVQATVAQSIESMTGVLDGLKTTFNNVQSQVTKLKDCAASGSTGDCLSSKPHDSHVAIKNSSRIVFAKAGGDATVTLAQASDIAGDSDVADQAQAHLDSLGSILSTVSTIVASAITLMVSLLAQFMSMLGGLGTQSSLGNMGNIGNMLGSGAGGVGGLTNGLGGISGLSGSYTAITSQLDIGNFMSGNALGSLTNLSSLLNV